MTTVKQLLDQFNLLPHERYKDEIENIDIGDYTFTNMSEPVIFIREFTNRDNPDIVLRINYDRFVVSLLKFLNEDEVEVTSWRYGDKVSKVFPREMFEL